MTLFKTTAEQKLQVYEIATELKQSNSVPNEFIAALVPLAIEDQGVFDLLCLWRESELDEEKREVVADLQEAIDDYSATAPGPLMKPKINFQHLDDVARNVAAFKKKLRDIVDQRGGITVLAQRTGIPQPSLSRMFNSGSMPRRTTLYKIAVALDLEEKDIITDWSR